MAHTVIQLPLDVTGTAPGNRVTGEVHDVGASGNRAIVPNHGPFYTRNLVVRAGNNPTPLTPDTHYRAVQLFAEATLEFGAEICALIVITDETLGNVFSIEYQALGGDYSASVDAIIQMIDALEIDERSVRWGQIIGKPAAFPSAPHLHDLGDVYGFEFIVAALESVRQAILTGDAASHEEIYQYIDARDQELLNSINGFLSSLNGHIGNTNNPHNTNKGHVGLGLVQNYPVATTPEAQSGTLNTVYMTALRVREAIDARVGDQLTDHIDNLNNPHQVTKLQVGLGNVDDYATATQLEAEAGTTSNKFLTVLRGAQLVQALAVAPLTAHIDNVNNPHNTTKTHVGLGLVQNYGMATQLEAEQASTLEKYMSPGNTRQAINALVGAPLTGHIQDRANPHQVTKTQVGLGNVGDYGMATQLEAEVGATLEKYMSPTSTRQAIAAQAGVALAQHTSNTSNPHNTTKDQVGLGNLSNYLLATAAMAQEGTAQDRYMSPYLVRLALESLSSGRWIITGSNAWGCAREERSGLTIQWGSSAAISVGRAAILHYRRRWSNASAGPLVLMPSAIGTVNAGDVGEWAKRSPFYATWFRDVSTMALPAGTTLPPDTEACYLAFGRFDTSLASTGQVNYLAIGQTDADSLVVGAPVNGRGTVVAPYTPTGPTTALLTPNGPVAYARDVTTSAATVYSDYIAPTLGGGDGSYAVVWSVFNAGGRPADVAVQQSGNNARLAFNAQNMGVVGATDAVTVTLRCSATSAGNTVTRDVTITLTAKRVYSMAEPTNLEFEFGDVGWIKSGTAAISTTGAYAGNWKGRAIYNGGAAAGSFAALGTRACTPGQTVSVACMVRAHNAADQVTGRARLVFVDAAGNPLVPVILGNDVTVVGGATWRQSIASAVAPVGAAAYTMEGEAVILAATGIVDFDNFTLAYVPPSDGPGDGGGCVAVTMYLAPNRMAATVQVGELVDVAVYGDEMSIAQSPVRKNTVMPQPCWLMTTVSDIQVIASDTTPMTMKDLSIMKFNDSMVGQLVFVDDRGNLRWEAVKSMEYVGIRDVVLFAVDDQCYFAGVDGERRIATHNAPGDAKN